MTLRAALTIGNFDGLHRGHRALIASINDFKRKQPESQPVKTVVITFEPHPIEVLKPGTVVPRLCGQNEKIELLQSLGIDEVRVVPFTKGFAHTPAKDFFEKILIADLHVAFLTVGHNFHFGYQRQGTPGKLIDWCEEADIPARIVEPIESDGERISSSIIRKLIQEGHMVKAARLLGRDYSLSGDVLHGDKRGRQLGFPTANIIPEIQGIGSRCVPGRGVYVTTTQVDGNTFPSVTNVGVKPTVSTKDQLVIETHLIDFNGDLYGKKISVEFKDRIRDEKKFAGLEELKAQINADRDFARTRLGG